MKSEPRAKASAGESSDCTVSFGKDVFGAAAMKKLLAPNAFRSLMSTIKQGKSLDPSIADQVAAAMKTWAIAHGATHFTHWFQPLTGTTAEKHESFLVPDGKGGAINKFSGAELIKGEPDASSFPSGGLRVTFEARGYTAWDPTSPAFLKKSRDGGAVLCIPTVFFSYHGESLDNKAPLLRSMHALSTQICRLGRLFGIDGNDTKAYATLGPEQEYFLIDRKYYEKRIDLVQTGRTLFGRRPAKHQQMEDHYFGSIKSRVSAFMNELDAELWRLGVPAKTRHNEVAPAQFELAPMYEELNLAVDHNMVVMEVMREVAERHGFACLLHEKPFAGVNGSGKHNNWAVCGPDGKNWLTPGDNPHENAKFLTMICALMKAVDTGAPLMRAAVASAGNDHRLGANEAPPAIISIFLGEQLTDVVSQIEKGGAKSSKSGGVLEVGVSSLPALPRDATDRNRTSPFAFTGNKFEFRAVGSGQTCARANIVLNTIVAEALDEMCTRLEKDVDAGKDFNESLQELLQAIVKKHKRILFDGDNYTEEWQKEAARRGLPNIKATPEALKAIVSPESICLFEKYGVLSEKELRSRYEVNMHTYQKTVAIEGECAATMVRTLIAPAAFSFLNELAATTAITDAAGVGSKNIKAVLTETSSETDALLEAVIRLEKAAADHDAAATIRGMALVRNSVDNLERLLPSRLWPLPSYADMMLMM
ncbi:MAG: glutamine synthetase III [bacterium]